MFKDFLFVDEPRDDIQILIVGPEQELFKRTTQKLT
jgi:hypothetical protein